MLKVTGNSKLNTKMKVSGIHVLESHFTTFDTKEEVPKFFNHRIQLEQRASVDNKKLEVVADVRIYFEDTDQIISKLITVLIFDVEDLESAIIEHNGEKQIDLDFVAYLNTVATSTVRGIMFQMYKGTALHQAILPLFSLDSFEQSETQWQETEEE